MTLQATEHSIQNAIIALLRYKGWYTQRQNSGAIRRTGANGREYMTRLAEAGTPDILALKSTTDGNRILFVEVKRPKMKTTHMQDIKHEELREHGFEVVIATSTEDLERQVDL